MMSKQIIVLRLYLSALIGSYPEILFPILSYTTGCADKSLARLTSRCILFDGENISFDACLVIYINSINVPTIMIINRIYETQNLLSLYFLSFLVGLRTYQHPGILCCTINTTVRSISIYFEI